MKTVVFWGILYKAKQATWAPSQDDFLCYLARKDIGRKLDCFPHTACWLLFMTERFARLFPVPIQILCSHTIKMRLLYGLRKKNDAILLF